MADVPIGADGIERLLPHRYPLLLVDRVLEWKSFESIRAVKNVTANEPHFQGHFPGHPIMPGVLVVEAMAQACGILVVLSLGGEEAAGSRMYLAGITKARFKRPVVPGDALELDVKMGRRLRNMSRVEGRATVGGDLACSAELLVALDG